MLSHLVWFGLRWPAYQEIKRIKNYYFLNDYQPLFLRFTIVSVRLIKFKEESMDLIVPTNLQETTSTHLKNLLQSLPRQSKDSFLVLSQEMVKCPIQPYTSSLAQEVFSRLVLKSKNEKERKNWKIEETSFMFYVLDKYCFLNAIQPKNLISTDWESISSYVPGRSGNDCKFRFLAVTPNTLAAAPWQSEEKELLVRIIQTQKSNPLNWKTISQKLYSLSAGNHYRTGKQCRQQYSCFLNPNLKKGVWTIQEDYLLICLFEKYGRKWSLIAKEIQGRNQNAIKNRFFLLFQQKNTLTLSNSDLNKRIKRKKEKIQREELQQRLECSFIEECLPKISSHIFSLRTDTTQRWINEDENSALLPEVHNDDMLMQVNTPLPAQNVDHIFAFNEGEQMLRYISF